ncbi:MAG: rhodanese-related sulfurtransferase [Spirosomataceae bacterium]|jgi:rhodanese-related sulfurtransferase
MNNYQLQIIKSSETWVKFLFAVLIILLISIGESSAQVKSKSFDRLLNSMLSQEIPTVSVSELAKEKLDKLILLDAREKEEYNVSHLKNARWIGYDDFNMQRVSSINKDSPIIIYCSIGVRSEKIGKRLQDAGFTNVRNLYGSIFEWVNQDNPVYDNSGKRTNRIHAYNRVWGVWLNEGEKVY